jgi:hypothetical protein
MNNTSSESIRYGSCCTLTRISASGILGFGPKWHLVIPTCDSQDIGGGAPPSIELPAPHRTATGTLKPRFGNDALMMRQHLHRYETTFNFKVAPNRFQGGHALGLVSKHRSCSCLGALDRSGPLSCPDTTGGSDRKPQK